MIDFSTQYCFDILFKSSPKVVCGKWYLLNSALKKHETQKPFWFLGFPNRHFFRFALLSRGAEKYAGKHRKYQK